MARNRPKKPPVRASPQETPTRAAGWTAGRYRHAPLVLIVLLAAFLRLYQLGSVPAGLNHDEGMNGSNALENIETGPMRIFYPENTGREGLFINIQTAFVALMGNTALALRLPAALFGIFTVLGIYWLAGGMFGKPIGLAAAFLTATSFWHLIFSRTGLRAIAAPCFLVWGICGLLAGIRRAREGRPYLATMLLAGAVYGLGFHTYIAYRVTPAVVLVALAAPFWAARKENWTGRYWRACAAFGGAAALAVAPLALYFLENPGTFSERTASLSVMASAHPLQEIFTHTAETVWMFFGQGDAASYIVSYLAIRFVRLTAEPRPAAPAGAGETSLRAQFFVGLRLFARNRFLVTLLTVTMLCRVRHRRDQHAERVLRDPRSARVLPSVRRRGDGDGGWLHCRRASGRPHGAVDRCTRAHLVGSAGNRCPRGRLRAAAQLPRWPRHAGDLRHADRHAETAESHYAGQSLPVSVRRRLARAPRRGRHRVKCGGRRTIPSNRA